MGVSASAENSAPQQSDAHPSRGSDQRSDEVHGLGECGDFETILIVRRQWLNVICKRLWYIALSHSQPFRLTFRSAPQRDVTDGQGACIIFKAILHNLGSVQTSDTALEAFEFSTALDMCQTG